MAKPSELLEEVLLFPAMVMAPAPDVTRVSLLKITPRAAVDAVKRFDASPFRVMVPAPEVRMFANWRVIAASLLPETPLVPNALLNDTLPPLALMIALDAELPPASQRALSSEAVWGELVTL